MSVAKLVGVVCLVLALGAAALGAAAVFGSDAPAWPQWRGPLATGEAPAGDPPIEWSETKNVRFKVELGGLGSSTPVVAGDLLFVTAAVDLEAAPGQSSSEKVAEHEHEWVVYAVDRRDGSIRWRRVARTGKPHEGSHPDATWASSSAVTDGEHVYASFGSQGLYAYDLEGKLVWERDLGDMTTRLAFGEGSSPVIHEHRLIVTWDHEGDSFIVALDKHTGVELWRSARDEDTSWATPIVVEGAGGAAQVITSATNRVRSYDPSNGALLWEASGMTQNVIPSPVFADGVVYATSGFRGNALLAIKLEGAKGDITGTPNILWSFDQNTPYVPSPLLYRGRLYLLKLNSPILTVFDVRAGKPLYGPVRVEGLRNVYASPVGAAGRVYLIGRQGESVVLRDGESFAPFATNLLEDEFDASPAVVGSELYLRGRKALYCISEAGAGE